MRSNALLLAVSLFATGNVLAGPCKPQGSTSDEATISYGTATATALESSTLALSETTTSPEATTTTSMATGTTALISDAESSTTVATTTTALAPQVTFALTGAGGSVTNAQPQGSDQAGTLIVFNPGFTGVESRHYTLDTTTGRLQDAKSGNYVCAYYGYSSQASVPANIANCDLNSVGPNKLYNYLDCRVIDRKLSCTAPPASCYSDDDTGDTICASAPGNEANNQFFYQHRGSVDYWYISRGSPAGYTSIDVLVSVV